MIPLPQPPLPLSHLLPPPTTTTFTSAPTPTSLPAENNSIRINHNVTTGVLVDELFLHWHARSTTYMYWSTAVWRVNTSRIRDVLNGPLKGSDFKICVVNLEFQEQHKSEGTLLSIIRKPPRYHTCMCSLWHLLCWWKKHHFDAERFSQKAKITFWFPFLASINKERRQCKTFLGIYIIK